MIRTQQDKLLFEIVRLGRDINIYDLREIFPDMEDWQRRSTCCSLIKRDLLRRRRIKQKKRPYILTEYYLNKAKIPKIKDILKEELEDSHIEL